MKPNKKLFFFAGEASGDRIGAQLLSQLKEYEKAGVGGPLMRKEAFTCWHPMEEFQMMGFAQVIKGLFKLRRQFKAIKKEILEFQPDACILIDYPGFNLRLAKLLRKAGYKGKIIQYVSPTVWVWGKGRIKTLEKYFDHLLTILPFEKELFSHTSLPVTYVGHPTGEAISKTPRDHAREENLLALFPGSRFVEIERNYALQLELAKRLKEEFKEVRIAISCQNPDYRSHLIEKARGVFKESEFEIIPAEKSYSLMQRANASIAKSGTVTLELGLYQVPSVVVYELDLFNRLFAQYLLRLKIPLVSMTNILLNKEVFPEFVTKPHTPEGIYESLRVLWPNTEKRRALQNDLEELQKMVGQDASQRAGELVQSLIESQAS